jgi:multimeric flavodoxin WrbA
MKFLIVSGNPKKDGLCRKITDAIIEGALEGGAKVNEVNANGISLCRVCDDGWGTCLREHKCEFGNDGFDALRDAVKHADAVALITPVYWGEMAEGLKAFCDRFRRCENFRMGDKGALSGKNVLLAASPGGSGRGGLTALSQLERFCEHTNAVVFDYIITNRWNSDYKRETARAAAKAMAQGRKNGETV